MTFRYERLGAAILLGGMCFVASACGESNPATPSTATPAAVGVTAPATGGGTAPANLTQPGDGPTTAAINFPPRNEPNLFFQNLTNLYRDVLRRPQTAPTYVDPEGQNVWLTEYFRFSLNGCSHAEAVRRTLLEITAGGSQPVCGLETPTFPPRNLPFEFQGQLENTYRDVIRRGQILSYVDSEGANVWLAQYLRFRVSGCSHADAENKVFMEIRGGGVQPACEPTFSFQGTWSGQYRIASCTGDPDSCSVFTVGSVFPITSVFQQSGTLVSGTMSQGGFTGPVSNGTVQGNRLTGLRGELRASGIEVVVALLSWDTSGTGDSMAGSFVETLTYSDGTQFTLGTTLQGVTRVSALTAGAGRVHGPVVSRKGAGASADDSASLARILGAR